MSLPNFVEAVTVEEANSVDLSEYRHVSIRRNEKGQDVYVFARRAKKIGV